MSLVTTVGYGVAGASSHHLIVRDSGRNYAGKTPVLYCHHATGTWSTGFYPAALGVVTDQPLAQMFQRLASLDHAVGTSDQAGTASWSNDAALAEVTATLTELGARTGCRTDRVLLLGDSMGSTLALNWARANASKVAAIALLLPIPSLSYVHGNPGGNSLSGQIDTAYGGSSGYTAAAPTHDPALFASSYKDMNIKFWAADDDVVGSRTQVDSFIAAIRATGGTGSTSVESLGNVGHTIPLGFDYSAVTDFLHAAA